MSGTKASGDSAAAGYDGREVAELEGQVALEVRSPSACQLGSDLLHYFFSSRCFRQALGQLSEWIN